MDSKLTFIDLFCGMGTARLGFEQNGWECVYSVEFDKHKRKIYEIIFGKEPEGVDICNVNGSDLPRATAWVFGFPCQDISVAGKQTGFDGHRSSLYFEVMRLLSEIQEENRPQWLLAENVKNFLSVNNGYDFLAAQIAMDALGYDCEWNLLNSKNFGVPQNRERVFLIGHSRRFGRREVFPLGEGDGEIIKLSGQQVVGTLKTRQRTGGGEAFIAECKQPPQEIIQVANIYPNSGNPQAGRIYDKNGISPTLDKMEGGNRQPKVIEVDKDATKNS